MEKLYAYFAGLAITGERVTRAQKEFIKQFDANNDDMWDTVEITAMAAWKPEEQEPPAPIDDSDCGSLFKAYDDNED